MRKHVPDGYLGPTDRSAVVGATTTRGFAAFAGGSAVLTAFAGLIFTVTFAIFVRNGAQWAAWASSLALVASGVLGLPVMIALYELLRVPEEQFALLGLVVGVAAALGAAAHGGFYIAVLANPPVTSVDIPSEVDPRGLATFAASGLALAIFGILIMLGRGMPRVVGQVALVAAVLLLVVYFGRLIVLDPHSNVIKPFALLSGIVACPAFYLLVGRELLRQ